MGWHLYMIEEAVSIDSKLLGFLCVSGAIMQHPMTLIHPGLALIQIATGHPSYDLRTPTPQKAFMTISSMTDMPTFLQPRLSESGNLVHSTPKRESLGLFQSAHLHSGMWLSSWILFTENFGTQNLSSVSLSYPPTSSSSYRCVPT